MHHPELELKTSIKIQKKLSHVTKKLYKTEMTGKNIGLQKKPLHNSKTG